MAHFRRKKRIWQTRAAFFAGLICLLGSGVLLWSNMLQDQQSKSGQSPSTSKVVQLEHLSTTLQNSTDPLTVKSNRALKTIPNTGFSWSPIIKNYQRLPISREPSAAVALPEHKGILVLDDEPSDSPSKGLLFYQVNNQNLTYFPVVLPFTKQRWDDWEAATASPHFVYLMTSHSRSFAPRSQLCRIPRRRIQWIHQQIHFSQSLECVGGRGQQKKIVQTLIAASLQYHFSLPLRFWNKGPKLGGVDIEGLAWDPRTKALYVGLRGPLATLEGRAFSVLLRIKWGRRLPRFHFVGLVDLENRGIRDLLFLPSGKLLLSGGPMGKHGLFVLYGLTLNCSSRSLLLHATRLTPQPFPSIQPGMPFKAEAIAWYKNSLFVFSDTGDWEDRTPAHFTVLAPGFFMPALIKRP